VRSLLVWEAKERVCEWQECAQACKTRQISTASLRDRKQDRCGVGTRVWLSFSRTPRRSWKRQVGPPPSVGGVQTSLSLLLHFQEVGEEKACVQASDVL
jgi:hypothetical protein